MSDFWTSELGEITGKAEDAFAKSFTVIPDGTMALAKIESFVNDVNKNGFRCLAVNWLLTEGEFKGAKVTQKIKVFGDDPQYAKDDAKTRHRALNMLKLLYQQFDLKPKSNEAPSDMDLLVFMGKVAGIKIRETEPREGANTFNWVSEVHKAQGFKCETGTRLEITHVNQQPDLFDSAFSRNKQVTSTDDTDVPF